MSNEKIIKIIIGVIIVIFVIYIFAMFFAINAIGNDIDHNGGIGKSVGKFIHDVNTEANKK